MKIFKQILRGTTVGISCAILSSTNVVLADNDLQFRPEKLEFKYYEIGFRNSNSGKLEFRIMKSDSAILIQVN